MYNHWVVMEDDYNFGQWDIELTLQNLDDAVHVLESWLQISAEYSWGYYSKVEGNQTPMSKQYLEAALEKSQRTGLFPFLRYSSLNNGLDEKFGDFFNICHYDELGNLKDSAVHDSGAILREINPNLTKREYSYANWMPPVDILSSPLKVKKFPQKTTVHIQLKSNLFFPEIPKIFTISEELFPGTDAIDNSILAAKNGTRLNGWLTSLNGFCLDYGEGFQLGEIYSFAQQNKDFLGNVGVVF